MVHTTHPEPMYPQHQMMCQHRAHHDRGGGRGSIRKGGIRQVWCLEGWLTVTTGECQLAPLWIVEFFNPSEEVPIEGPVGGRALLSP